MASVFAVILIEGTCVASSLSAITSKCVPTCGGGVGRAPAWGRECSRPSSCVPGVESYLISGYYNINAHETFYGCLVRISRQALLPPRLFPKNTAQKHFSHVTPAHYTARWQHVYACATSLVFDLHERGECSHAQALDFRPQHSDLLRLRLRQIN